MPRKNARQLQREQPCFASAPIHLQCAAQSPLKSVIPRGVELLALEWRASGAEEDEAALSSRTAGSSGGGVGKEE